MYLVKRVQIFVSQKKYLIRKRLYIQIDSLCIMIKTEKYSIVQVRTVLMHKMHRNQYFFTERCLLVQHVYTNLK